AEMRRITRIYPHEPVMAIFGDLVELQQVIFGLLDGKVSSERSRDLYFLAGLASGLLADANEDLGNLYAAGVHARTAFISADHAGTNSLRVWPRFLQTRIAYWDNRPLEAIRYAEMAADTANRVRGTVTSCIHAMEARAWAAIGDTNAAWAALRKAE